MMTSIIIPTYNAGRFLETQLNVLSRQTLRPAEILIVDSSSTDDTVAIARSQGAQVFIIPKAEFNHGGTRTMAGRLSKGDVLIYLTQDALPVDEVSLATLVRSFQEEAKLGIVFGRQIPHPDATAFGKHLRLFNYPTQSYSRTFDDRERVGIRAAFCSNSYAAYRRSALDAVGWFKEGLLMAEDTHVCAKMLMNGYHLRYVAEAQVYHSHSYSLVQEFRRYFDLGVFYRREQWLLREFGALHDEGVRFVLSELRYLVSQRSARLIPASLCRSGAKWLGFRLGYLCNLLPKWVVRHCSMHGV